MCVKLAVHERILLEPIVTEELTKYYGKLLALDNLNLKIEKGHCVGFLGPNGAGKSTTIKTICNLIRPTNGRAYINGYDTLLDSKKALKNVGAIVEVPEFYPYLNPIETLSYLGKIRGLTGLDLKKRIVEVLELVKLTEWAQTKIAKFSRGMKQRLGIAQAMLHDPSVLILDEPALGLDPRGTYETREIIKSLVKQDKTIFLASHMLHEVQEVCDSVALINKGKLLAYDRVESLEKIFRVQKIEVETLSIPEPKKVAKIEKLKSVSSVSVEGNRLMINFDGTEIMRADLLAVLVRDIGLRVVSFKPSTEALEEIYLQLIEKVT